MTDFFAIIPRMARLLPLGAEPQPAIPTVGEASRRWWVGFSLIALFLFSMLAVLLVVVAWSY
jgi:hypothetical protein